MKILIAVILFATILWIRLKMPFPVYKKGVPERRDYGEIDTNWIFIIGGAMILAAVLMKIKRKRQ